MHVSNRRRADGRRCEGETTEFAWRCCEGEGPRNGDHKHQWFSTQHDNSPHQKPRRTGVHPYRPWRVPTDSIACLLPPSGGSTPPPRSTRTLPIFSCIQDLPSTPHLPQEAGASFHPTSRASNRVRPSGAMQQLPSLCRNETLHLLAIPPGSFFSSGDEQAPTRIGVRRHVPRTEAGARFGCVCARPLRLRRG